MSAPPAITPACQLQITSAFESKWSDASNPLYAGIDGVVGVSLADATENDIQRLFVCAEAYAEECCKGLTFPSTCTVPPCDQCRVVTTPPPPPVEDESVTTGVPDSCKRHLDWAVNTGKFKTPALKDYQNMTAISGVDLVDATREDFQKLFVCDGIQNNDCNNQGLEFPKECSAPPCNVCRESFVPESCEKHLDWAVAKGKFANPPLGDYKKMKRVSGVEIADATKEDFQKLFVCEGVQDGDCNAQGLEFPNECSDPPCNECPGQKAYTPSKVTIDGYNLYVNGELFHINGVCWSPVPAGRGFGGELYSEWSTLDAPMMAEAGMNAVRPYRPILDLAVLDTLYENGLMVTVPVMPFSGFAKEEDVAYVVNKLKDHPAVLMWTLGNEWNLNTFYNDNLEVDDCVEWIKMASAVIKKLDTNHPIATVYGDVPPAVESMVPRLPDVDVWAMNTYRFDTFRGLFDQWQNMNINKPLILGEFGADAWDSSPAAGGSWDPETKVTTGGKYNPESQAATTRKLMEEIYRGSTKTPEGPKVNSGGFIFEWSDEYWKRGDPSSQQSEGLSPCPGGCGPAPDRSWNEDYWGLSGISRDYSQCGSEFNADSSCPLRQAYYDYKNCAKP